MRISAAQRARVLSLCGALLLAAPAAGQQKQIDSPYRFVERNQSLGVFAGYAVTGKGQLELGMDDAPAFGIRYRIHVSGPFRLEAELAIMQGQRTVRDTTFTADSAYVVLGEVDSRLLAGMATLRFDITGPRTWHGLQPFLLFGGGLVADLAGASEVEDDLPENVRFDIGTSFAGQIGGGLEWYLSQGASLRVDARNVLWKVNTPTAFRIPERGRTLPDDEWTQNFVATVGFAIHF